MRFAGLGDLRDQELLAADAGDDGMISCGVPWFVGDPDPHAIASAVPLVSFTCLKRSRSSMITVGYASTAPADAPISSGRAMEPAPVAKAGQRIGLGRQPCRRPNQ
jgi:hypothetical protein